MKLSMIKESGPSITIIGSIREERGLIHTQIFIENFNLLHFQQFFYALMRLYDGRRVMVVLDNFTVHHPKINSDFYTSDFKEIFLQP